MQQQTPNAHDMALEQPTVDAAPNSDFSDFMPTIPDSSPHEIPKTVQLQPVAVTERERDPHIGRTLGGYMVVRKLAEGGMGTVYVGRHEASGHEVAIKVLLPEFASNQAVVQRFFNEAKAAQAIRHPGVISIFGADFDEYGTAFIVMELLQGESLADRIKRDKRLTSDEVVAVATQVAEVLSAAHAHGIVHRDLKPANMFLTPDASAPGGISVKLLDFGVAKLLTTGVPLTRAGDVIGTPLYMSPEQCRGGTVDHRADLYALGCLIYAMVCGRPPFLGVYPGDMICAHLYSPVPPPRMFVSELPQAIETLIMDLLKKDPNERIQTADDALSALNAIANKRDDDELDALDSYGSSSWKRSLVLGGAGVLAALAGALTFSII